MKKLVFHGAQRVRRDIRKIRGREVEYELYTLKRPCGCFYVIEVKDSTDSRARCFGKVRKAAFDIYRNIVGGAVTPCTLDDIAEDFGKANNLIN